MTRAKRANSSSKLRQARDTHGAASNERQSQEEQGSTQPVVLDATESAGVNVLPTPSATINEINNNFNPQDFAASENRVNEKKPTVLHDESLGKLVGEYDLYTNQSEKRLMLLQYPNRDVGQPYSDRIGLKPLELRIKPKCGVVEVDVPMIVHFNFDKEKGIQYGQALRKSRVLQEGSSYGLTGGLRSGVSATRLRSSNQEENPTPDEPSSEALLENFEDANNKGHVMNKLTLGGRIVPWKDGDPIYLLGVFKGRTISLNKLDAMVQLRPLFTHLDALTDQDKSTFANKIRGGTGNPAPETEAKAVNMTAKSTEIDDTDSYGDTSKTSKTLRAMREESWQRLSWVDSEDERSYRIFTDEMFVQDFASAPQLVSTMTNEQWLDALSCPRIDPIKQGKKVFTTLESSSETSETDSSDVDSAIEEIDKGQEKVPDIQENDQTRSNKPEASRSRRKR